MDYKGGILLAYMDYTGGGLLESMIIREVEY